MIKKIIKILSIITLILVLFISYLSIFGIKTTKFNNQIQNKISENKSGVNLDLKAIKISLSPLDFKANISTLDIGILFNNKKIELESLKTKISLLELFKNKFSVNNLQIKSKSIEAKKFVSFLRYLKNDSKLLFLEMMIKDGYLEGSVNLNFDEEGKVKNDFKIKGIVKSLKIKTLTNHNLDNLNFSFDIEDKKYKFLEIDAVINKIKFNSPSIVINKKNSSFLINGRILNKEKNTSFDEIKDLLNSHYNDLNLKDFHFISDNNFSLEVSKKFKLSNLNINSEINLSKLTYKNNFKSIQKYFPEIKESINLKNHEIKLNYNKDKIEIIGSGQILIEDNEDRISYEISKKDNQYYFKKFFEIKQEILINELQYKKEKNKKASLKIDGILYANKDIFLNQISLLENDNIIFIKDLNLNNKFKISDITQAKFDKIRPYILGIADNNPENFVVITKSQGIPYNIRSENRIVMTELTDYSRDLLITEKKAELILNSNAVDSVKRTFKTFKSYNTSFFPNDINYNWNEDNFGPIIIPKKGAAQINGETIKTSTGALFNLPICKVPGIESILPFLKESGIHLVACTEKTQKDYTKVDYTVPVGIIMGNEESGIAASNINTCDSIVKLPLMGKTGSLNVSVASGIIMYEAVRQRLL